MQQSNTRKTMRVIQWLAKKQEAKFACCCIYSSITPSGSGKQHLQCRLWMSWVLIWEIAQLHANIAAGFLIHILANLPAPGSQVNNNAAGIVHLEPNFWSNSTSCLLLVGTSRIAQTVHQNKNLTIHTEANPQPSSIWVEGAQANSGIYNLQNARLCMLRW